MIRGIARIIGKIIVGIILFYFLMSLVFIPLVTPWLIRSQGKKLLGTQVNTRSVFFNPFLLRLSINGFQIFDDQQQVMAGFDRLSVDASFKRLLKKEYRIESLNLDGLLAVVTMAADGSINLLSLVPQKEEAQAVEDTDSTVPAEPAEQPGEVLADQPKPLPPVVLDLFHLTDGRIDFIDEAVTPRFSTTLSGIDVELSNFSTDPEGQAHLIVQAALDGKGTIAVESVLKPLADPLQFELSFKLNNYALTVLTPYVGKYTAREVADGKLDVSMDYRVEDNQLTASHKLLVQRFGFGKRVESKDALNLPFGLAVALLEDPQGKISISLPVTGDMSDPQFEYMHLVGQTVKNFFLKLVTKPFMMMASLLGSEAGTEELGYARFNPGESVLSDAEKDKLRVLVKGLIERPKLILEINGSYDSEADWKAIKTDVFNRDYEQLSKESTGSETEIYQILYRRRFGVRALRSFMAPYKRQKPYDEEALRREIKRRLIEEGAADIPALEAVARARAQGIYDFMAAEGMDTGRLRIGPVQKTQSSFGYVPLEFTLTFFDDSGPEEASAPQEDPEPAI